MHTDQNAIKFAALSLFYDPLVDLMPLTPHRKLAEKTRAVAARQILDLCTGTGYTARHLAKIHPAAKISGVDISPQMLNVARKKSAEQNLANVEFTEGDAANLPFPDASFDAATISFALHELPTAIRAGALKEIARVLKPGGQIFIVDLDRPQRWGFLTDLYLFFSEPPHAAEVVGGRLQKLLQSAGLSIIDSETDFAGFYQFHVAQPTRSTHGDTP